MFESELYLPQRQITVFQHVRFCIWYELEPFTNRSYNTYIHVHKQKRLRINQENANTHIALQVHDIATLVIGTLKVDPWIEREMYDCEGENN